MTIKNSNLRRPLCCDIQKDGDIKKQLVAGIACDEPFQSSDFVFSVEIVKRLAGNQMSSVAEFRKVIAAHLWYMVVGVKYARYRIEMCEFHEPETSRFFRDRRTISP